MFIIPEKTGKKDKWARGVGIYKTSWKAAKTMAEIDPLRLAGNIPSANYLANVGLEKELIREADRLKVKRPQQYFEAKFIDPLTGELIKLDDYIEKLRKKYQ